MESAFLKFQVDDVNKKFRVIFWKQLYPDGVGNELNSENT